MWEEWGWRAPTDQAERLLKFSKMSYAWVFGTSKPLGNLNSVQCVCD